MKASKAGAPDTTVLQRKQIISTHDLTLRVLRILNSAEGSVYSSTLAGRLKLTDANKKRLPGILDDLEKEGRITRSGQSLQITDNGRDYFAQHGDDALKNPVAGKPPKDTPSIDEGFKANVLQKINGSSVGFHYKASLVQRLGLKIDKEKTLLDTALRELVQEGKIKQDGKKYLKKERASVGQTTAAAPIETPQSITAAELDDHLLIAFSQANGAKRTWEITEAVCSNALGLGSGQIRTELQAAINESLSFLVKEGFLQTSSNGRETFYTITSAGQKDVTELLASEEGEKYKDINYWRQA